jgi:hypothetical protein
MLLHERDSMSLEIGLDLTGGRGERGLGLLVDAVPLGSSPEVVDHQVVRLRRSRKKAAKPASEAAASSEDTADREPAAA